MTQPEGKDVIIQTVDNLESLFLPHLSGSSLPQPDLKVFDARTPGDFRALARCFEFSAVLTSQDIKNLIPDLPGSGEVYAAQQIINDMAKIEAATSDNISVTLHVLAPHEKTNAIAGCFYTAAECCFPIGEIWKKNTSGIEPPQAHYSTDVPCLMIRIDGLKSPGL